MSRGRKPVFWVIKDNSGEQLKLQTSELVKYLTTLVPENTITLYKVRKQNEDTN